MIRLLIVDDERGITESLVEFFEHRGFNVRAANSGEEAIRAVNEERPNIVFLDILMKGMSGMDVLERIKKIDRNIKVIMLTALGDKSMADKAKELGADEYITKPFRVDYLDEVVIKKVQELMR